MIPRITTRERQVLGLLVDGASGGEISRRLRVSPHTVRSHIGHILTKLQVRSRLEAAAFAVRYGLVDGPDVRAVIQPGSDLMAAEGSLE